MTNFNSVTWTTPSTTAATVSLAPRYEYISVTNDTGVEIFVRTDGQTAVVDADFNTGIMPGATEVLANMMPLWDQAQTVIPAGSNNQWGQAKNGQAANPGTQVSIVCVAAATATTPTVTVQGAG